VGDVARDKGSAHATGQDAGFLDIGGPDDGAFGIVENREVYGAGDMILRKLAGAAHIDYHVELRQRHMINRFCAAGI
jgi:hypothetical protein